MKFAVASEHREFFRTNHSIEFEGLFSAGQMLKLKTEVDEILATRLKTDIHRLAHEHSYKFFNAGRDLWRSQVQSSKINAAYRYLAEIAAELLEQRSIRLGYDQLLPSFPKRHLHPSMENRAFIELYQKTCTLNEISGLRGILCGIMLCLEGEQALGSQEPEVQNVEVFSKVTGNCVFFHPDSPLDFTQLCSDTRYRNLLIVFTHPKSAYFLNEADSHAHHLKHLGYTFEDPLADKLNPIIYR